ncbi:MAG: hypothetical protein Q7S40_16890 [Opitutaceae bacterium]|nr:hypothetical protein [Opitutaceae bacterium]
MKDPRAPSDSEINELLAGRLRRTSPDFELRWRELRAELAGTKPRRAPWAKWLVWPGLATVGLAVVVVALWIKSPVPPAAGSVTFEELIALNDALQPASALLDPETREALLNLPPTSSL